MARLHVNGVWRKVLLDDALPATALGELLCSFSSLPGELWVSLVEKAYMKVRAAPQAAWWVQFRPGLAYTRCSDWLR